MTNDYSSTLRLHCVVIGIGSGAGTACARRFTSKGYNVSMIARGEARLAKDIGHTTPYRVDMNDLDTFRATLEQIVTTHGVPQVVIWLQ